MSSLASHTPVVPARRLRGTLELPADKSIAHRALIVGALSGGPSVVTMRAPGLDVLSTITCLRALGVAIAESRDGRLLRCDLHGRPVGDAVLDCGNSGTTMRLLAGAVAGLPLRVTLDGDASLRGRPMERVAALLRSAGADAETTDGHAPVRIAGRTELRAVTHRLPVASAQLLGAAALAALAADGTTRIESPGPTRDHIERVLAAAGVAITREGLVTTVIGPATPRPLTMTVPGDSSSAAPWLVAAAIHVDAELHLTGVGLNPTRVAIVELLRRMGAEIDLLHVDASGPEPLGELRVHGGRRLRGVTVEADEAASLIDELPLVAVAMAAATGDSEVRGAAELRLKESDRIGAMTSGLSAIGASVTELPDGWRIRAGSPRSAHIVTHGDHRVAIAFAVAATAGVAETVELDDPGCTAVSYPDFWVDLGAVTA